MADGFARAPGVDPDLQSVRAHRAGVPAGAQRMNCARAAHGRCWGAYSGNCAGSARPFKDQLAAPSSATQSAAYRIFKPPFSLSATVSPSREAVDYEASGDDSRLAMTIRPLNRSELPGFEAR